MQPDTAEIKLPLGCRTNVNAVVALAVRVLVFSAWLRPVVYLTKTRALLAKPSEYMTRYQGRTRTLERYGMHERTGANEAIERN